MSGTGAPILAADTQFDGVAIAIVASSWHS